MKKYDLYEISIQLIKNRGRVVIYKIAVNTQLHEGYEEQFANEIKESLDSITPKEECNKIWNNYDYNALEKACDKLRVGKDINTSTIIKTFEQFEEVIKKEGIYTLYEKEKNILDKKREFLKREDLVKVKFRKYESWETGLCFLILSEQVPKDVFNLLLKSGLHYHEVDEDNEERFTGWCIGDSEDNILKLAENGIKVS